MSDKVLFEELNPNGESEVSNETPPKTKKERKNTMMMDHDTKVHGEKT